MDLDFDRTSTSAPISVPAVRPESTPIAVETCLFPSLRHTALVQSLANPNFCPTAAESPTEAGVEIPCHDETSLNAYSTAGDGILGQDGTTNSTGQCLAEIQSQLDIVNNSVLALVNPYNTVIKVEQTAE